ncbi:surface polysaccharide O-acyltransferase-like enzyme [Microbacterium sp. W4I4]|uniref:acyltransferase family protein n=1 Tax=Microbacterium sp. W4I4 TaxID=3042295 RepID=UPI002789CE66|nr:acyltransferase [Microbacterium sp. W4I4]MDQ0612659.1 surface polysaccharide O-acyltransferase-like enzyme [Microbacterium sp. W4I4]
MHTVTSHRDSAVDFVRALSIAGVVTLHSLMVGVTLSPDGPVFANAGDVGHWIVPVSWVMQVMPMFFVVGGFAGITALRAQRRRGASGAAFVVSRVRRLLIPAIASVATAGLLLALLADAGLDPDLVDMAGYRYGQPLWFLGVFLVLQAVLPAMARLHERAPLRTLAALAAVSLVVDVARVITGSDGIGYLNLLFVWLTMQQVGFLLADGRIDALSRRIRITAAAVAFGLLMVSFGTGFHSPDLIANTNPPTTALLLVGVIQTAAFSLFKQQLTAFADRRPVAAFTGFMSARAMTVYLWHMPVLLTLAGLTALSAMVTGDQLPVPTSGEWWLSRPLWLVLALSTTALLAVPLSRLERLSAPIDTTPARAAVAVLIGAAEVALLLVVGTSPMTAVIAVGSWLLALRITGMLTTPLPVPALTRSTVRDVARIPG